MKCPRCQAQLMPVKGELLCLQCGHSQTASRPRPIADLAPKSAVSPKSQSSKPPLSELSLPAPAFKAGASLRFWLQRLSLPGWLVAVVITVAVLAVADSVTRWYYHDRVYPGVKVGQQSLGGLPFANIDAKLSLAGQRQPVSLVIGQTTYELSADEIGLTANSAELKRQVIAAGRNNPLALAGVWQTLTGAQITAGRTADVKLVDRVAGRIATEMSHPAVDAVPIIAGSTPLVVAEKSGQRVDQEKLRDAIMLAATGQQKVVVSASQLKPAVTSASYNADVDDATAKIAVKLNLKVKSASYTPAPGEVASWLVFGQPGSGAKPDEARVGAYVAKLPGTFDRPATVAALIGAMNAKQPLNYIANTKKNVPVQVAPAITPVKRYSYCKAVWGVSNAELETLTVRAELALTAAQGWSLGGQLSFLASQTNCNVTIWLVAPAQMAAFSSACVKQSSCQVGDEVVINADYWKTAPSTWKGTLDDYRNELINHEIGHWLGFDHSSCTPGPGQKEPLSQTTVTVAGCSPHWYEIPAELQGQKVLAGF